MKRLQYGAQYASLWTHKSSQLTRGLVGMCLFALLYAILDDSVDFVTILSLPFMCLSAVQIND